MNNNLTRYKKKIIIGIIILILISISTILWGIFFESNMFLHSCKSESFSFKYDNTWKITNKSTNDVFLKHKSNSYISISVKELDSSHMNKNIYVLASEIKFDIVNQKNDYILISEEENKTYKYVAYRYLYENADSQNLITILKSGNKIAIINFVSKNEYFDILLDSVDNIIHNIDL